MPGNVPEALWDNKITVWSNRKLLLLAVSKRQSIVLLLSEIQAMQIHMELATNYWTLIHTGTALGCFQTEVQIKWILSWDAWRQLDGYCLPLGLWRGLCYSFNTFPSVHGATWFSSENTPQLYAPCSTSPCNCLIPSEAERRASLSLPMPFLPLPFPALQGSWGKCGWEVTFYLSWRCCAGGMDGKKFKGSHFLLVLQDGVVPCVPAHLNKQS